MLENEFVGPLKNGSWELDCGDMKLTQDRQVSPEMFTGSGVLRQDKNGEVVLKIYPVAPSTANPMEVFTRRMAGTPGKLVAPEQYYTLRATDVHERVWTALRISPDTNDFSSGDGYKTIVSGTAQELQSTRIRTWASDVHKLTLVFFADVKIPCNDRTERHYRRAGVLRGRSSALNLAKFEAAGWRFEILKEDGTVTVEVESDAAFPEDVETRIVESLSFVLGCTLSWNILEMLGREEETVRIRGRRVPARSHFCSPIYPDTFDSTGAVWRLFGRYVEFVLRYSKEHKFHACSRFLFSVFEASAGTISTRALALGIAVEGMAKELFPNHGKPAEGWKNTVQKFKKHCLAWPGLNDTSIPPNLPNRIPGLVDQLCNVRAADQLRALVDARVVRERHVKAWQRLRNRATHGITVLADDLQELVDLCAAVQVLMHNLVFRAIGYEGPYTDYSTYQYPIRYYRGRPIEEAEIQHVAYRLWQQEGRLHGRDWEHWFEAKRLLETGIV